MKILATKTKPNSGDTIVEVMMSLVILSFVIIMTYTLSSKTFQSGLNAQYRDQATSYNQQQLEMLKEADISSPSYISTFTANPNTPFCINPSNPTARVAATGNNCLLNNQYSVTVTYYPNSGANNIPKQTFQIQTSWPGANGVQQNSIIYYKPSNSFNGNVVGCDPHNPDPNYCSQITTNAPAVGITSDANNPQNPNAPFHITWFSSNIKPGTCRSTGPGFNNPSVPDNGTSPDLTLTSSGTYQVTCDDNSHNPVASQPYTVNIAPPVINYFRVNGNNAPTTINVSYKDSVTVSWSTNGTTGCTASGPWTTNNAISGSVSSGVLTSNSTFGLSCTTVTGTTITAPNITVNVGPAGLDGYYYCDAGWSCGGYGPYLDPYIYNISDTTYGETGWLGILRARTGLSEASCASVLWVGQVLADTAGTYQFSTYSDDGVVLYVNYVSGSSPIISDNSPHSYTHDQASIYLNAGWTNIALYYNNNNGNGCNSGNDYNADIVLNWITPGGGETLVPQDHLRPY